MSKWRFIDLSELCNLEKGKTGLLKAKEGEYPLVATGKNRRACDTYQFNAKAVCIPLVSSTGHGHASLKYVHYQEGKFALGTILVAVIPKDENTLNAQFLHLYLSRLKDIILVPLMTGAANVTLTVTKLKTVKIPLPPIEEQLRIVSLFNSIDNEQAELTDEIIIQQTLLKKLRQAILQEAIEGKLTTSWREQNSDIESASILLGKIKAEKEKLIKDKKVKKQKLLSPINKNEKTFDIPNSWEWSRFGKITNIVRGGSPRPAGDKRFYDGDIPFLKVADLTRDSNMYVQGHTYSIKKAGLHKTRYITDETLMLTNSGATLGVPKICNFPTAFNDGVAAFIYMNIELYKPYFYFILKSKTQWFLDEASRGQGQPNLNTDIIGDTLIGLPPFEEQKQIVQKIETLFKICDNLEAQINNSKKNSQTLMKAVLKEAFEM